MDMNRTKWSQRHYIELDFFAGAPNPRWELTGDEITPIVTRLTRLERRMRADTFLEPNSWYGGVILHIAAPPGPGRYLTFFNEHVLDSTTDTIVSDPGRVFERMLFERAPGFAAQLIDRQSFEEAITFHHEVATIDGVDSGVVAQCPEAPAFEVAPPPVRWNRSPGKDDNNCYNYANNVFSDIDDALPGGVMKHEWTEREMHDLLTSDGLVPVKPGDNKTLPAVCAVDRNAHLVAVCLRRQLGSRLEAGVQVSNFADFHCFRLDQGGKWSHKDGRKKATQKDNSNQVLTNLAQAKFKLKHVLVGYYWTFPGPHRKIRTP